MGGTNKLKSELFESLVKIVVVVTAIMYNVERFKLLWRQRRVELG